MSDQTPPGGPAPTTGSDVPPEYSEAYERAYRHSLAEYATELMSPARPGKRAAEPAKPASLRLRAEKALAELLADPRRRAIAGVVSAVALILLAYGAGRLAA